MAVQSFLCLPEHAGAAGAALLPFIEGEAVDASLVSKDRQQVLDDLAPSRREAHSRNNGWYDVRLRPYRTVEDKIDGVVMTFSDVADRHKMEEALRDWERQLQLLSKG